VYLVRYADDLVVTGKTTGVLSEVILPSIVEFLEERGMKVKDTKTRVISLAEGFDLLGFNLRKRERDLRINQVGVGGVLIATPSNKNEVGLNVRYET
jgi:hypothetical protein